MDMDVGTVDQDAIRKNPKDAHTAYNANKVKRIQIIYIISLMVWLLIVYKLNVYHTDFVSFLLLSVPIIVFGINYYHAVYQNEDIANYMFRGNFLAFGILIASIVISWSKLEEANKIKLYQLTMVSLILIMLSLIDVWIKRGRLYIIRHVRSSLQTMSLSLLAFVLYLYYILMITPL